MASGLKVAEINFCFFLIGERAKSVDAPDAPDTRAKTSTSVERRRGLRAGRESEGVTFRHKRARCERSEPCVITVLAPSRLKQVCTYSMRAKCLREFQEIYRKAHDRKDPEHNSARKLYQFYLDIAPEALLLYDRWKSHQGFAGTGIRSITRDKREILEVPDGLIFPILASLSAFAMWTTFRLGKPQFSLGNPSNFGRRGR